MLKRKGIFYLAAVIFISAAFESCSATTDIGSVKPVFSPSPTLSLTPSSTPLPTFTPLPSPELTPIPSPIPSPEPSPIPSPTPIPTLSPTPVPEPVQLPENGEVNIYVDGSIPLTIETPDTDYYILKLRDRDTREIVMTWFIYPNSQIQTYVPYGHYVMQYATGIEWYGEEDLFGPDTVYGEFTDDFFFEYDYEYTLELMAQVNGNLSDMPINPDEFN